jgi:hypothetical protein
VFEGSIAGGKADLGETVRVQAHDGRFLAWAACSPHSQIRVRAWSFDENERIDSAFFLRRIEQAIAIRARLPIASDGVRLIHGEADGLPGLIVDRYGDTLSAQFLSAGAERWKATIADHLLKATGLARLYERSDANSRELEGLQLSLRTRAGVPSAALPDDPELHPLRRPSSGRILGAGLQSQQACFGGADLEDREPGGVADGRAAVHRLILRPLVVRDLPPDQGLQLHRTSRGGLPIRGGDPD